MPLAACAENNEVRLLPPIQTDTQKNVQINTQQAVQKVAPKETQKAVQNDAQKETESLNTSVDEAINNSEIATPKVEDIQEMTPNANEDIRKEVVDDTNSHLMEVIKKFLFCMGAVIISSIFLFVIGTFMNKFNLLDRFKKEDNDIKSEEIPISNDENDALKIFFDTTK